MDRLHPGCCLWRFAITRLLSRLERAVSSFTQVCVPGPGEPAALGLLAADTSGHTWGSWQCGMTSRAAGRCVLQRSANPPSVPGFGAGAWG